VEKVCIPLWRGVSGEPVDLADALLHRLRTDSDVRAATVHVEASEHASLRHGSGSAGTLLTGLMSLWLDAYQDLDLAHLMDGVPVDAWHAYLVTESVPQPYEDRFTWAEGERSPGLSIVTMLDKPGDVDEAEFYRCWHGLHRVTTAQCHPFWSYVRNEVVRPLTPGAPVCRGIVAEAAPAEEDFLDPHRFYVSGGDPERLRLNQKRVFGEVSQFIDMASIQVAPMSEYVLRRLAPTSP
jgi:hypothetical protein